MDGPVCDKCFVPNGDGECRCTALVEKLREDDGEQSLDRRDLCKAAAAALETQVAKIEWLRRREAYFAERLSVADGGRYQADWDAAIRRVIAEREEAADALKAQAVEIKRLRSKLGAARAAWQAMDDDGQTGTGLIEATEQLTDALDDER